MKGVVSALVLFALICSVSAQFEYFTNLQPYASNPVVYSGQSRAYYPHVIKVNSTDYRMYYSDVNATGATRTALATSTDGNSWTFNSWLPDYGHAAINYDASGHGIGYKYILWVYQNGVAWTGYGGIKTYYSNDGIDFSTYGGVLNMTWMPWSNTTRGNYFYGSYGVVQSFYNSSAPNTGTNPFDYSFATYFDCSDGANEARCIAGGPDPTHLMAGTQSVVIPPGGTWNSTQGRNDPTSAWDSYKSGYGDVIQYCGNYLAWYDGGALDTREALGKASSTNGISFTKDGSNPFIRQNTASWFNRSAGSPSIVLEDTYARLYIGGRNATSTYYVAQYRYDLTGCPTTTTTTTSTTSTTTTTTSSTTTTTLPSRNCNELCRQRGYDHGNGGACQNGNLIDSCCCIGAVEEAQTVTLIPSTGQIISQPESAPEVQIITPPAGATITQLLSQGWIDRDGLVCKGRECIEKKNLPPMDIFSQVSGGFTGIIDWIKGILGYGPKPVIAPTGSCGSGHVASTCPDGYVRCCLTGWQCSNGHDCAP